MSSKDMSLYSFIIMMPSATTLPVDALVEFVDSTSCLCLLQSDFWFDQLLPFEPGLKYLID